MYKKCKKNQIHFCKLNNPYYFQLFPIISQLFPIISMSQKSQSKKRQKKKNVKMMKLKKRTKDEAIEDK